MPYKMNAQSFARMRNQQSVHKRAKDARWRSHKVGARTRRPKRPQTQGCVIVLARSFARMRNQKSKHDVQGCTIAVAQSRRKDAPTPTTAIRQPRYTFARSTSGVLFLVRREGEPATCGSCRDAYKQQLIQFFIQRVDKLQQYIAKSV